MVTITLSAEAHARLLKNKLPGDSFSDVVLRELPNPYDTAGELLDRLETAPAPKSDPKLRRALLTGRGRRSNQSIALPANATVYGRGQMVIPARVRRKAGMPYL